MKWAKTQSGKLVNLAQMAEVNIQVRREVSDAKECEKFTLVAWEPSYTDTSPSSADLATFDTCEEAAEAMSYLHDWLRDGEVGCDYSAVKAHA